MEYQHLGITETFDQTDIELRAEVGLLTHNVKVEGKGHSDFEVTIPACEAGFNPGRVAYLTYML